MNYKISTYRQYALMFFIHNQGRKMAQWVKALVTKPQDKGLIPKTHMRRKASRVALWSLQGHVRTLLKVHNLFQRKNFNSYIKRKGKHWVWWYKPKIWVLRNQKWEDETSRPAWATWWDPISKKKQKQFFPWESWQLHKVQKIFINWNQKSLSFTFKI